MKKNISWLPRTRSFLTGLAAAGVAGMAAWWVKKHRQTQRSPRHIPSNSPQKPEPYPAPYQEGSPWPVFRRDPQNSGFSPQLAIYSGDHPWCVRTAKGIFSTPVIDRDGSIYFGSGDHNFYALASDGSIKWQRKTGEIIDSAAALLPFEPELDCSPLVFLSGDGFIYNVRSDDGSILWKFEADLRPEISFNRWFEGNVAVGSDGTLYAGNTNFLYYALTPKGELKWTYPTGSNNWSQAAFSSQGTIYWGSCDTFVHAVNPDGTQRWRTRTLGFIAASAAVGRDGTIYIGSFDSNLYAIDPNAGRVRWKFQTGDHIYSSAALSPGMDNETSRIYIASTDGRLYAVDPQGRQVWQFFAGDPIRSSPVISKSPDGKQEIIYFGCGDGNLYAINGSDGSLRWRYDTTPLEPELQDRNDLNGSPALGETGVYIGGEHGELWYIPYDYPLYHPEDPRGQLSPGTEKSGTGVDLAYVTPGGTTLNKFPNLLNSIPLITLRLQVYKDDKPVPARYATTVLKKNQQLRIRFEPEIQFSWEISADGAYLHILPEEFLLPGQTYKLRISGCYRTGGKRIGNLNLGGRLSGHFGHQIEFRVADSFPNGFPLQIHPGHTDAIEWTRLAAVLPSMLPSLNQIGFDYMHWLIGPVLIHPPDNAERGTGVLWAIGARLNTAGELEADPTSDFTLPLNLEYRLNAYRMVNRDFHLAVTGIQIPFRHFELRGCFNQELAALPGSAAIADTEILSIPNFGPKMVLAGLGSKIFRKLFVTGTYITRSYAGKGKANQRPAGVKVGKVDFVPPNRKQPGWVKARLQITAGYSYSASNHRLGIILLEPDPPGVVYLDYHPNLTNLTDSGGNLAGVHLTIPAGTRLPAGLQAAIMFDIYPLHITHLHG